MIHNNSRLSYEKCKKDEKFARISHRIAYFFETRSHASYTDREVKEMMFLRGEIPDNDMNMVRPKITKLIKDEMLEECGTVLDTATKRRVRKVRWRFVDTLF